MKKRLKKLEAISRKLDPGPGRREELTAGAVCYARRFLEELPEKPAFVDSADKGRRLRDKPFKEKPAELEELLELMEENLDHPGLNPASAGHLGYIPGGGLYPSAMADFLAAVSNRYAGVFFSSPGAVQMENMCIRWMCDLIGYPETSAGNLTSGGSIANLIALVTARDAAGLSSKEYHKAVIYTTKQVHHCADKAFGMAGMRDSVIRRIPMDDRFRMQAGPLRRQIEEDQKEGLFPFLIFASAGTTDTGSVDPLEELAGIAGEYGLWLHVDAAYGGFFLLTEQGKKKMKGIGEADSVIIDPHKGLFLPYGTGAVLVRDGEKLYESQHLTASYLQDTLQATDEWSPADLSPELSKHFRGLRMWLPLQLFGVGPFRAALEEKLLLTRYFYEKVQKIRGIEVGPEPELSVMIFRYLPDQGDADDFNKKLIRKIHEDGRVFISSTNIGGAVYIRLAVLNFRTHLETIELTLEILREKIERLTSGA